MKIRHWMTQTGTVLCGKEREGEDYTRVPEKITCVVCLAIRARGTNKTPQQLDLFNHAIPHMSVLS